MSNINQLPLFQTEKTKQNKVKANGLEITYFPTVENWLSVITNRIAFLDKSGDFNFIFWKTVNKW